MKKQTTINIPLDKAEPFYLLSPREILDLKKMDYSDIPEPRAFDKAIVYTLEVDCRDHCAECGSGLAWSWKYCPECGESKDTTRIFEVFTKTAPHDKRKMELEKLYPKVISGKCLQVRCWNYREDLI